MTLSHIIQVIILLVLLYFIIGNLIMAYYEAFTGETWEERVERKKMEDKQ